jgi:hypothetical protein
MSLPPRISSFFWAGIVLVTMLVVAVGFALVGGARPRKDDEADEPEPEPGRAV